MHDGAGMDRTGRGKPEPIAVIGMSGVFPQASSVDELWRNLAAGRSAINDAPCDRGWRIDDYFDPIPQTEGKTYARRGGFLSRIDNFDPLFFEIPPKDAERLDPSARLFLQECWRALEDAGYSPRALDGARAGLFYCAKGDYASVVQKAEPTHFPATDSFGPARLSYFLNLTGPAVSIDTACSSTLSAIAYACDALTLGNCDIAIAGGGGVNSTPFTFVTLSQMLLFSPTERCSAFDVAADGTVLGEAIAAVVLKPLSQALRDGDAIHGVLRGWGTNQDGRTNGVTAPSAASQTRLQCEVYERFGIDPSHISYVEAHGTGTKLGDRIEVQALTDSFRRYTSERGYCALGSLKTNIGHTFFGAGVCSLIKVLLSMRHGLLAPSLNFETVNPAIGIDESPFMVNTALLEWKPVGGHPRCAAINAMGATGINAHLVVEEFRPAVPATAASPSCETVHTITLSAKSADRLKAYARNLLDYLRQPALGDGEAGLQLIARTYQSGRAALGHRLAIEADSVATLADRLDAFLAGRASSGLHSGVLPSGAIDRLAAAKALEGEVTQALATDDQPQLAQLWARGATVDWGKPAEHQAARLHPIRCLPTYPFADDRCWPSPTARGAVEARLHPLLHANASNFEGTRFSSRFNGHEFFLADHRIRGQRLLPGVAYLELARAAVAHALASDGTSGLRLSDIVWLRPFEWSDDNCELQVDLEPAWDDDGSFLRARFEIRNPNDPDAPPYCQGIAAAMDAEAAPQLDLEALRRHCNEGSIVAAEYYPVLSALGYNLGERMRSVEEVFVGQSGVLGRLRMPAGAADAFILHPSLMDGGLQSTAGQALIRGQPFPLTLPFACEAVCVHGPCAQEMWAWARPSAGRKGDDWDIDLCDDSGKVRVALRRLNSREPSGESSKEPSQSAPRTANVALLRPVWRCETTPEADEQRQLRRRLIVHVGQRVGDAGPNLPGDGDGSGLEIRVLNVEGEGPAAFMEAAEHLLTELQQVLGELATRRGDQGSTLIQFVVPPQAALNGLGALSGLIKAAVREDSRLIAQIIQIPDNLDTAALLALLDQEATSCRSTEVRLTGRQREILTEAPLPTGGQGGVARAWRDGGVYLIAGGLGGLGLLLAEEIGREAPHAVIVLASRAAPTEQQLVTIRRLRQAGLLIECAQANLLDRGTLEALRLRLLSDHGRIDGIVHAAGVLADSYILRKNPADLRRVLAPKVVGLVNLDEVFARDRIELFLAFGSLAGPWSNAGQGDYAAANAFVDHYMARRAESVAGGRRHGRSLVVDWPLWRNGGMRIDAAHEELMASTSGFVALETAEGFMALNAAFASAEPQVLVVKRLSTPIDAVAQVTPIPDTGQGDQRPLTELLLAVLRDTIGELIHIDPSRVTATADLGDFGLDSIRLTQLANALNRRLALGLSPTLFFEHRNLTSLTAHIAELHGQHLRAQFQSQPQIPHPVTRPKRSPSRRPEPQSRGPERIEDREAIAIVGISCRFAGADDLHAFWSNLAAGRDSIVEVPPDRWRWEDFFGDPATTIGVTNSKWGGFINGVGDFDPGFFGISPREAEMMDPQHRLILLHVWLALEDAAIQPRSLAGSDTAIYVATHDSGYYELYAAAGLPTNGAEVPASMAPNRVSFYFDLHGPSELVETACSSSLVAIHKGVECLRSGQTKIALVGGVETIATPAKHISFSQKGMLSPEGRCKTFSKNADGYVRAEGVGILVLKRLSDAIRDGDHIYGKVRGAAVNHGGRANSLTAPNPVAQAQVIELALDDAGLDAGAIGYVEAHGTGTELGDPIEINGLKAAFSKAKMPQPAWQAQIPSCAVGSVKTNIGHAELAAGVAGVIKVLMQMKHGQIAPSLHSRELNPHINLAGSPFYIPQALMDWPGMALEGDPRPMRRAGVSSFGVGGVNAHVVLEEHVMPKEAPQQTNSGPYHFVLSAKTEEALKESAAALENYLWRQQEQDGVHTLPNIAYTLQVGREPMAIRTAFVASAMSELIVGLARIASKGSEAFNDLIRSAAMRNGAELETSIAAGDWARVTQAWLDGAEVGWDSLYVDEVRPRRISLPGSPFKLERFWITESRDLRPNSSSVSLAGGVRDELAPAPPVAAGLATDLAAPSDERPRVQLRPIGRAPQIAPPERDAIVSTQPVPAALIHDTAPERIVEIRDDLRGRLAHALLVDEDSLDIDNSFVDLGVDSVVGVDWVRTLNRAYGVSIKVTKIYDHPTLRSFARYFADVVAGAQDLTREAGDASAPPSTSASELDPLPATGPAPVREVQPLPGDLPARFGLVLNGPSTPADLELTSWSHRAPGHGEVSIEIFASAVNFADTLCVSSLYPTQPDYPFVPGFEVAGRIAMVGKNVNGFAPGDRVFAMTGVELGGHASHVTTPAHNVALMPKRLTFEEACSLPVAFCTSWTAFESAGLKTGESVLIQAASGACGLVAAQLAALRGCRRYGTSSKASKRQWLQDIGFDAVFDYQGAFDEDIRALGPGVDVVINTVAGPAVQRGIRTLAPFGRYVELAVHALRTGGPLDLSSLVENQTVMALDLRRQALDHRRGGVVVRDVMERLVAMVDAGQIVPIVSRIYPLRQIREAFEYVARGEHVGKVVISHAATNMEDRSAALGEALSVQGRVARQTSAPGPAAPVAASSSAIAIVGVSGSYPMSPTVDALWENLRAGRNCITAPPSTRWSARPQDGEPTYPFMGVVEDAEVFDPGFFGISPREAKLMDPQQRLFLQSSWSCLEDAGYAPGALAGARCGVFAGCSATGYTVTEDGASSAHVLMGNACSVLSARLSYHLDLKGPCMAIDTACSSSLVAICEACTSLAFGDCDMALAGGVCVLPFWSSVEPILDAGMLSDDGRCFTFDHRANGFVPSEGVGVVLLKRLAEAVRDGDPIYGVVRGWGVNHDGRTNGMTAPSAESQAELEREVHRRFAIDPRSISYVEAHGTGTSLGDPIEVAALVEAFGQYSPSDAACALGSVKSNIGHAMAAAGVAGLTKVLLSLRHEEIPPTINFERLNPEIDLGAGGFVVNSAPRAWKRSDGEPRRAAVSSFSYSGTNAHLVIEEAPVNAARVDPPSGGLPILISARSDSALREKARALLSHLRILIANRSYESSGIGLVEVAYTLQAGRDGMTERLGFVARDLTEVVERLQNYLVHGASEGVGRTNVLAQRREMDRDSGEQAELRGVAVATAIANKDCEQLLKLWLDGYDVPWRDLYADTVPTRVNLPTYPFEGKRYWPDAAPPPPLPAAAGDRFKALLARV